MGMKILSCIFALALLSSPLFAQEVLHDDTVTGMTVADGTTGYIAVISDAYGATSPSQTDIVEADYITATNLSAAVLLAIAANSGNAAVTTLQLQLDILDDIIAALVTCAGAVSGDTDCKCGTAGASAMNGDSYSSVDDACSDDVSEA